MSKSQDNIQLPPGWAEDTLSDFIQASFQNALATFVHKKQAFNLLQEVDYVFNDIGRSLDNGENPISPAFLHRSRSAFLASCRLSMSGQASETFTQLRSCLEYALYALHIKENPALTEVWLKRHDNEESLKKVKYSFLHVNVMKTLHACDVALHDSISELYQRTIDFGGHPNERAVSSSSKVRQDGDAVVIRNQYLHGDSAALDHALKTTAQVGLGSLMIFRIMYKEQFDILGLNDTIESLKRAL